MCATTQEPTVPLLAHFLATLKTASRTADYTATGPSQKGNAYSPAAGHPEPTPISQSSRATHLPYECGTAHGLASVKPVLPTAALQVQLPAEPWQLGAISLCHPIPAVRIQAHLSSCFWCFSSRAWAFICCTSMVSGFLRLIYSSWLPMQSCRILLLILRRGA